MTLSGSSFEGGFNPSMPKSIADRQPIPHTPLQDRYAQRADHRKREQTDITAAGGKWTMPVVGMGNSPSQFQAGGPAAWAKGSYGYKKPAHKGGHIHQGVDIYADKGTAIVVPVNGTVTSIGDGKTSGKYVKVKGDDGFEYYFAHMDSVHTGLSRGMRVGQGQYLGGVGSTGNASGTQAHLHFEIRKNGKSVNPNSFLETGQIQSTTPMSSIPGLNSVEQVQAYIDEQVRAAGLMANAGNMGFDPTTWNQDVEQATEEQRMRAQRAQSQSMLGATLNSMSAALAGGNRTPMAKGSTALVQEQVGSPTAAQQRQTVENPEA